MPKISQIPGVGRARLELLEAVGYVDLEALARAEAEELWRELDQANGMLRLLKVTPTQEEVVAWVREARSMLGHGPESTEPDLQAVNHEQNPQLREWLPQAPFAIPLPARVFMEHQVRVAEIPPAIVLNHHQGDLEFRTDQWVPQHQTGTKPAKSPGSAQASQYVLLSEPASSRLEIDTSKVRPLSSMAVRERRRSSPASTGDVAQAAESGESSESGESVGVVVNERLALLRAPRPETNRGRRPESRFYIRGVLHTHPKSIWCGAMLTLVTLLWLPASIVAALLLLLSDQSPANFGWVPPWVLVFPVILPLVGGAYLIWGLSGSCRICGQKLFVHRPHRKHIKAHQIRFLGYIIPLCCHILVFRWFRCTHCGTPVRLKE